MGKRIKARIDEIGLTQKRVAELSGISSQRLGNYVQGTRPPDICTLAKIANALGVSVDWVLGLSEHGPGTDIEPVLQRLLVLDGMDEARAAVLSQVAQEALRLLNTLPDDVEHRAKAHLAVQAIWNTRPSSKPS
ncbi:helix-turn-helix domain-containing protein [Sphingorhabdus sp. SMR4y]|uniref:helix-turn-helix domain-containing protein n=1 Tax=Sphingorhabdus sp. SMR4y TaxID=2584094 RepID=UPI001641624F|nr:helix-turn-helix transcriptional regulator [Sphingorhabdus sp. SMR4y]